MLSALMLCVDEMAVAAECITFGSGKFLLIISDQIEQASSRAQANVTVTLCERVMDTLCNTTLRHAVLAETPFPPELTNLARKHAASASGLVLFFDKLASSPYSSQLHGDMLVPAHDGAPAASLRDLANRMHSASVSVLGADSITCSA